MKFNEKLQELRKNKGITQEELAQNLFVSRTAVSKWESGRGYPNLDSLKEIAKFFNITIDELLSSDEVLNIAEEEKNRKISNIRDLVFGLLDLSTIMLFFLPLFALRKEGLIYDVSLLELNEIKLYLLIPYFVIIIFLILFGIARLALQNCNNKIWINSKDKISLIANAIALVIFIISLQVNVAILIFVFISIKALLLIKW